MSRSGNLDVESFPLASLAGSKVGLAAGPIPDGTPYLDHKTTCRAHFVEFHKQYHSHRAQISDLIVWNKAGFATESGIANVVIGNQGELATPHLRHGLLPGVFRQYLVQQGVITEKDIHLNDLWNAQSLYLVNSVRGWMPLDRSNSQDVWTIRSDGCFETPQST